MTVQANDFGSLARSIAHPHGCGKAVGLDFAFAFVAANIGQECKSTLADSIIPATARTHHATLWTQDADFEGFDSVRWVKKGKRM